MTKDICIVTKTGLKRISREVTEPHQPFSHKPFIPLLLNLFMKWLETEERQKILQEANE